MLRLKFTDDVKSRLENHLQSMIDSSISKRNLKWTDSMHRLLNEMEGYKLFWWVRLFFPKFSSLVNNYKHDSSDYTQETFVDLMNCAPKELKYNAAYMYDPDVCMNNINIFFHNLQFSSTKSDELFVDISTYRAYEHELDLVFNEDYFYKNILL